MDEAFQLQDQQAAQEFLRSFPAEVQRRGHDRFREGRVQTVTVMNPGTAYNAVVEDSAWNNEVTLRYDPEDGWRALCSCPSKTSCVHIFAAMNALLAEHRAAIVRQLSAGQATPASAQPPPKAKTEAAEHEDLVERLTAVTGSVPPKEALRFIKRLREVYLRCRQTRQFNYWDLHQLGFPLAISSWEPLKLWPVFPSNEHDFWLYIAYFLDQEGFEIPEFMRPITDVSQIAARIADWQRDADIEQWRHALGTFQPRIQNPAQAGEIDLRMKIDGGEARLEWRRPGQPEFEHLKHQQYRQLESEYQLGRLTLNREAELLWQLFTRYLDSGFKIDLESLSWKTPTALNRLLRVPSLESRIVGADGQPIVRVAEPLRWELAEAQDEKDDYRLRLVQADGSPLPELLAVLSGAPTLYLTEQAVFSGPEATGQLLDPGKENRIPAPALEQASGVSFLRSVGVTLPERVRDRVRILPYQLSICCELRETFAGSENEECVFDIIAEAADGHRKAWDGVNWLETPSRGRPKKSAKDNVIQVYDSAQLAEIPPLLEPLNLRLSQRGRELVMRVGKKFGDTFAVWLKTVPPHIKVHLEGELASLAAEDVAGRVKLEVSEHEIDWFDLRVVLDVADTSLTPAEIRLLMNAKGAYVRLGEKGWRRLRYDLGEEENERLAQLGLSPRELSAEPQRLHALQLADPAARKFLPEQQAEQIQRRASEIKARVAPDLPSSITAQLRPYQLDGFHFLAYLAVNRFGGILADDMGLGKTLQTLAWLVWLRERAAKPSAGDVGTNQVRAEATGPSLVVCPKSVMDNWHVEAARFAPGLRLKTWPAGELEKLRDELPNSDVHVLNYSQLRLLGESLAQVHWLAVVLDEGQYIKNPSSQTAQIARSLKSRHRLVLSGTPIENQLLDLWSLMSFTMPGILGSRAQFGRLYDAKGDSLARRRLAARVRPFLLRRTKTQVAKDLPDRIEEDLFCEIEGEQKTLYRAELKAAQQLLLRIQTQKELAQQQFHFLTSLLRLRQICCHPRLVQPDSKAASAKTEALLEQLEPLMEEGQKVLVFSQFVQMLDLLRPVLAERQWPVYYLAGQTENRGDLVRSFQNAEGPALFLISLKAGGFGLNLTAASYVVLFDPWWNPAVENQAIDRTHRIGQTSKVIAYRLLIKDSIEEKIRELQKKKKALVQDVLGEEKFAQGLTLEDMRFLFAD
jgi:SNF2-related domain/Helicase conserved C-terminal domain